MAVHTFSSAAGVLSPGVFRRIAVTRKHNVQVDTSNAGAKGGSAVVSAWNDITFYADGVQVGAVQRYDGPDVGSSEGVTLIGRAFGPGASPSCRRPWWRAGGARSAAPSCSTPRT